MRNILIPTDGSARAEYAFGQAAFYAGRYAARLHVLHVDTAEAMEAGVLVRVPPSNPGGFRARLHEAAAESIGVEIVQADLLAKSPEEGILDYARGHDIDLIVMATHGRRGLDHALLGSVAEGVARRAACSVLTINPTAENTGEDVENIIAPVDFS
ncbi:MAG: universal stress protein, partial [Rubricoccaceae bacterium]|nr:universal stress protein [Rubricoccaceae bacterium]